MRRVLQLKNYKAKIGVLFLAVVVSSCNSLKRVDDQELLIRRNSIIVDSLKVTDETVESLIIQKPNTTLLGYPLRLNLYNLAKVNPDSSFNDWLYRKEKRKKRLDNLLSEKQTRRLGESFLVKGLSEWLKEVGEPPAVLDTALTQKTLERLSAYYSSKGYFNNTTTFTVDSLQRKQRAEVKYKITLGQPFMLDSVYENISSKVIDSLYTLNKGDSFIKSNQQFDIDDFNNERERLTAVFRNNGVWNFQESTISYNVIADTTRLANDQQMNIELNIEDLKRRDANSLTSEEYKVFKFDKVNIFTDYFDGNNSNLKFQRFGDYTIYYRDKLKFKPKTLTDAVFFKKDSIYRDIDKIRTLRQLSSLNVFRYPSINFIEDSTRTHLTTNIYLTQKKKYSFAPNFEVTQSNIRRLGIGVGASLISRNIFKGAENLSISGNASFGLLSDNNNLPENTFSEIGADVSLNFPRIWLPFVNTDKIIPNYMVPHTNLKLGTTFQKNIGLDRQTFNGVLGYSWSPNDFASNSIELFNIQFINNLNANRFFSVYTNTFDQLNDIAVNYQDDSDITNLFNREDPDNPVLFLPDGIASTPDGPNSFIARVQDNSIEAITNEDRNDVNSINERRNRLTENNLIFASNYTFNKNNRQGATDNDFYQFRFKFESAGNFLSALSYLISFDQNDNGNLEVFDVPYSQYVKTEFDYIKYWDLSRANVLAFHSFFGIAIPYGNSDNIPFVRSYFAGGSNDNRAWRPYSLGPGRTSALNDFNEANLKLALNLEYRFPIAGNFKGALFVDAGNIWNAFDNVDDPDLTFNGLSSLQDIAVGSGFGIRYDFTYFVVRGDLGFKTYNPAEEMSKRWFRDYNFANSVLQIGINYPF